MAHHNRLLYLTISQNSSAHSGSGISMYFMGLGGMASLLSSIICSCGDNCVEPWRIGYVITSVLGGFSASASAGVGSDWRSKVNICSLLLEEVLMGFSFGLGFDLTFM
ncbi:hypothetical protein Nepgr_008775 [Nepenthes gracilis]|uniref:Uncharacterized protein n=1 Tax=Nepenthes gracilis TaxID=150966 RepID=A0AAD3S9A5_NEPGR|nr:hypothetical protein Nepgr_008775 [Nepenthes gracilis]